MFHNVKYKGKIEQITNGNLHMEVQKTKFYNTRNTIQN